MSRPRPSTISAQRWTASAFRSSIFGIHSGPKALANLQVEYGVDVHPNQRGHEIIFESLYQAIQQDPKFSASLLGTAGDQ